MGKLPDGVSMTIGKECDWYIKPKGTDGKCFHWTTEPPTQEGWYWEHHKQNEQPELVKIQMTDGELCIFWGSIGMPLDKMITSCHWLGPLPVPEPPTK